ncbi:MAG: hypothetical protein HY525_20455 [Betaproteobacteria bacterium]|nr:hypothetical protein [Betaproteobacteria bacterium]
MSKEVVNKLHAEVVKAIAVPSVKELYIAQSGELVGTSPEEFSKLIRNELQRWAEVVKAAGITLEQKCGIVQPDLPPNGIVNLSQS